ncbi:MAG TPA: alpha/beta fold hydrolase [Acidimicrobiales bacterium]|nr:alpha/beta fold hydrolase [Acidimicrobiales bacterium]
MVVDAAEDRAPAAWHRVPLADGAVAEVLTEGPDDGRPLLYWHGTPFAAAPNPDLARAAAARGLRVVTISRPGYAGSTARPGRRVADAAGLAGTVLDALGLDRFVTLGWSGGGPHALAGAAGLPGRCAAALSLAGVAPYDAAGLDWLARMGHENVEEFAAAAAGADVLVPALEDMAAQSSAVTGAELADALGDLVSTVDRAALSGQLAEWLAEAVRRALSAGVEGWRDDDLAFCAPWGFDPGAIDGPVSIWQGDEDKMVPFAHGAWLAGHVPGARVHLLDGEGHVSLLADHLGEMLDELVDLAGW